VLRVTLPTDGTGKIASISTSVIPGTSATHLGKAIDSAAGATDTGVAILAIRDDALTTLTPVDGDYAPLRTDSTGSLHVRVSAGGIAGIADDAAFTVATSEVLPVGFLADESSTDSVDEGDIGAARITLDRKQIVAPYAHTAGGWTPSYTVSAGSTNATSTKASAGQLGYVIATNVNAAVRYLKFYNKASAPTVGSDTPVLVIPIPGNTAGAGCAINFGPGVEFTTGIAWAMTTEATTAGSTGVSASEHVISFGWK